MTIVTDAFVSSIEKSATGYAVRYRRDGVEGQAQGDAVVMATGRRSVLPEGLGHLGLPAGRAPEVDRLLKTANPHVYAPGDVNGRSGRIAGAQILGLDAAQLIAPLALAVHAGLGAAALAEVAFPHPMISEGINKAARAERA